MSPKSSVPFSVKLGFSRISDSDLQTRVGKAAEGARDPRFSDSPIPAADLKAASDEFKEAKVAALDGGKTPRAAVVASREKVIQLLRQYSIYVDVKAKGDPELILAAGLADDLVTPASTPVAKDPVIRKHFDTGKSGEIGLFIRAMAGAAGYQLQITECKDDIPQVWGEPILVSNVKSATVISGLTPAVKYAVRVRAQIGNRYTDWSDYITIICT
jgi:hypothetical protein